MTPLRAASEEMTNIWQSSCWYGSITSGAACRKGSTSLGFGSRYDASWCAASRREQRAIVVGRGSQWLLGRIHACPDKLVSVPVISNALTTNIMSHVCWLAVNSVLPHLPSSPQTQVMHPVQQYTREKTQALHYHNVNGSYTHEPCSR